MNIEKIKEKEEIKVKLDDEMNISATEIINLKSKIDELNEMIIKLNKEIDNLGMKNIEIKICFDGKLNRVLNENEINDKRNKNIIDNVK